MVKSNQIFYKQKGHKASYIARKLTCNFNMKDRGEKYDKLNLKRLKKEKKIFTETGFVKQCCLDYIIVQ